MANKKDYELLRNLRDELNAVLGEGEDTAAPKTNKKTTAPAADEDDFDSMAYNDLKKLCKSRGLSAAGNREELIARLNGEVDEDEDEEPVKEPTSKKGGKKAAPVEEEEDEDEDDSDDDDSDEDDEDEEDVQAAVEAATEDMSLEDLAEFCEENGLSSKGKRQALIARIVKAVEAGDIELSDDEDEEDDDDEEEEEKPAPKSKKGSDKSDKKTTSKKKQEEEDEDDDEDEEGEPTKERIAALKAYDKDTRAQFKKGEIERDDLVEFLCDFHDKDKKAYKKLSDKEVLDAYIEASSLLINDEGDIVEEGAYTVNGVPYCCGRPLSYNEDDEQYVCEHCGGEYEADEE